jgi:hypothetical protein
MIRKTPIDHVAPGYMVELDAYQPEHEGCARKAILSLIGLGIVCGLLYGVVTVIQRLRNPTAPQPIETPMMLTLMPAAQAVEPTASPTIDDWSATGTALYLQVASPTLDYCWHLTPSPTPSVTPLPVTPDAWALQGTQFALETGTPTFTPQPTQAPPKAWCDMQVTATFTPFPLQRVEATAESTEMVGALPPTLMPGQPQYVTATPLPKLSELMPPTEQPRNNAPQQQATPLPRVIIQTSAPEIIVQTSAPQIVIQEVQNVVVVTATFIVPTQTPTPTHTPTATETPTPTATDTPSPTPSETPTDVPTATHTDTPTLTPTVTPSETPTETATP